MSLDRSILEKVSERVDTLEKDKVTMYALINNLKDVYFDIIEDGYVSDDTYIDLASFVLYAGFIVED